MGGCRLGAGGSGGSMGVWRFNREKGKTEVIIEGEVAETCYNSRECFVFSLPSRVLRHGLLTVFSALKLI